MKRYVNVLLTPADIRAIEPETLTKTTCVVVDILRATSSIVTALAHGADCIIPVMDIADALQHARWDPQILLAGERKGLRISKELTGGEEFHFGNSPREFTPERVRRKNLVLTTTNGSRALRVCRRAQTVLVAGFLNLDATVNHLRQLEPERLLIVCSGTDDQASLEDILGAGAICDRIWNDIPESQTGDSARVARLLYQAYCDRLPEVVQTSKNARKLLALPELAEDVNFSLQTNRFPIVAQLQGDRIISLSTPPESSNNNPTHPPEVP